MLKVKIKTSQNAFHFGMKCSKLRRFLGRSPRPPIVVRGFLISAIAASCLWRLQFPRLTCVYPKKIKHFQLPRVHPLEAYSASIFFTSNMSHYLKSLKICPGLMAYTRIVLYLRLFSKMGDKTHPFTVSLCNTFMQKLE